MVPQSNGKIFLTEERGVDEHNDFRSYNTFNFGRYQHKHKSAFGALAVLNEDTLAGGKSMLVSVATNTNIVLIPTVGDIEFTDSSSNSSIIQIGQAQLFYLAAGSHFTITNPYNDELVNYLQLWLNTPKPLAQQTLQLFPFNIDANKNTLVNIFHQIQYISSASSAQYVLSIGKFDGRQEALYKLNDPNNGVFIFVIEGAFEVQYRLLHNGDGLALWDVTEMELEALSNDAVLLVLEVPLTS